MITDREPVSVLGRDEAWNLLRGRTFGRLAVSVAGQPDVFPVNFRADENSIVFRSAPGDKLLGVTINSSVAFETDFYDTDEAWSVVVKGTASVLDNHDEIFAAEHLGLRSWIPTSKPVFVRIVPAEVSGRRFQFGPEPEPEPY
ncbi:MAG: pyridoxamine 5'-phosphate oxidase family protein [Microbacteriaceae bacterium]